MTQVTIIGQLGADPELKYTPNGVALATLRVAVTARKKQGDEWVDGQTTWYRCTAWRQQAENAAESLTKGTRVVVVGSLENREYVNSAGEKRTSLEIDAEDVAPSLLRATAKVRASDRSKTPVPAADNPWADIPDDKPMPF